MLFENMCQGCVSSSLQQLGCIVAILRFKFLQHNNSSSSTPSILFYRSAALLQQQGEILIVRLLAESGTQVSLEEKYKLQRVEGETLAAPQSGFDTFLLHKQEDSFANRLIKYSSVTILEGKQN